MKTATRHFLFGMALSLTLLPFGYAQPPSGIPDADLPAQAEVKIRINLEQVRAQHVLEKLQVSKTGSKERSMITFDDELGTLRKNGIQMRIRKERDQDSIESSIKLRETLPKDVKDYLQKKDFKCELNVTPSSESSSCTLSAKRKASPEVNTLLESVSPLLVSERLSTELTPLALRSAFSSEQEVFAEVITGLRVLSPPLIDDLRPSEVTQIRRWKLSPEQLRLPPLSESDLVLEHWTNRESASPQSLELSWKTQSQNRKQVRETLRTWFDQNAIPYFLNPPSRSE